MTPAKKTKKRSCLGCKALKPNDKCEFRFNNQRDIESFRVWPLEPCPKPKTQREYLDFHENGEWGDR